MVPEEVGRMPYEWSGAPWRSREVKWEIEGEKVEEREEARRVAESRIREVEERNFTIFTDGSVRESVFDGGAGVVVTTGDPCNPTVVERKAYAAGLIASSYQAEMVAMAKALEWLEEWGGEWESAAIVSDSQAGMSALREAKSGRLEEMVSRPISSLTRLGWEEERGSGVCGCKATVG